jgi:hypothetical protein
MAQVSGQWDPGPGDVAYLLRIEGWFDPAIQRPVVAAFLFAGTLGAAAGIRAGRRPA